MGCFTVEQERARPLRMQRWLQLGHRFSGCVVRCVYEIVHGLAHDRGASWRMASMIVTRLSGSAISRRAASVRCCSEVCA